LDADFSIPAAALAVGIVTLMMIAMSEIWLRWKQRRAGKVPQPG
jgi:hypothetical protein